MKTDRRRRRIKALQSQIQRLDRRIDELGKQGDRLTLWRLASFLFLFAGGAFLLLTWGALVWAIGSLILMLPFIVTVRWHRQVDEALASHTLMRRLKSTFLARMNLDWDNIPAGQPVDQYLNHPFAYDLDLLGERSIARLLDVSITQEGGQRLRHWLVETEPDLKRSRKRQALVAELIPLNAFRDRLALNALLAGGSEGFISAPHQQDHEPLRNEEKWSGQRLLDWLGMQVNDGSLRMVMIILLCLVPINLLLLIGYLVGRIPPYWLASWLIYAAILFSQSRKVAPIFNDVAYIHDSLRQLVSVFGTIEHRSFTRRPSLKHLLRSLREGDRRPLQQLRRANRLLVAAGLRQNPAVAILLNVFFPWDIFIAFRLEAFKKDLRDCLPGWLDLWYELEALFGLANIAFQNPGAPFAELISVSPSGDISINETGVTDGEPPPFTAVNLGHPLIPAEERVGNDFIVPQLGSLTIITGSNMAGKSSFLRTLGVNIRLALAGAPVLGDSLKLVPFRVAASITVTDSVTDGFSFFYAEVRRLKALLDELNRPHSYPLFFLIDEIFRGTNNRERLIGSQSYVKALLGGNGTGVIATHDLELVNLATANSDIRNAHFRDRVQGELMVFDYKLHEGPCPTTNALRIMELAGLPVDRRGTPREPFSD